ncbi:unnamed protein product [Pylaiella littoralis]
MRRAMLSPRQKSNYTRTSMVSGNVIRKAAVAFILVLGTVANAAEFPNFGNLTAAADSSGSTTPCPTETTACAENTECVACLAEYANQESSSGGATNSGCDDVSELACDEWGFSERCNEKMKNTLPGSSACWRSSPSARSTSAAGLRASSLVRSVQPLPSRALWRPFWLPLWARPCERPAASRQSHDLLRCRPLHACVDDGFLVGLSISCLPGRLLPPPHGWGCDVDTLHLIRDVSRKNLHTHVRKNRPAQRTLVVESESGGKALLLQQRPPAYDRCHLSIIDVVWCFLG